MNTNTIRIHYDDSYEREKQQRCCFPRRSIKVAHVCSLKPALDTHRQSADLYRRTPRPLHLPQASFPFAEHTAHRSRVFASVLSFFSPFFFFILVVVSSSRPSRVQPNGSRNVNGVLFFTGTNPTLSHFATPPPEVQRFRFRFRRASSSFVVVVLVVERPIRSNDGCLSCRQHLLRARTSDAFFSQESSRRKTLVTSLHSSTHTNKQTNAQKERERE